MKERVEMERAVYCPLPTRRMGHGVCRTAFPPVGEWAAMQRAMAEATAYRAVPQALFEGNRPLRVLFLWEELSCAMQCAAMLSARPSVGQEREEDGELRELLGLLQTEVGTEGEHLLSVPLKALEPPVPGQPPRPDLREAVGQGAHVLLYARRGETVDGEQMLPVLATREEKDLFLALPAGEAPAELVQDLQFEWGFTVCSLPANDVDYHSRVLAELARRAGVELSEDMDLPQVIRGLRAYRGDHFREEDLATLVDLVRHRRCGPCGTGQLLLQPYRPEARRGLEELDGLVGLTEVKEELRRILALRAHDTRRSLYGEKVPPACCNLAFCGPPGTCKSVAARLVARILQEEGGGSGAFVEAGREQLVGAYLGQTSIQVAQLFRQAKGGVLFLDEAGALLADQEGRDPYAVEAVNALVRHMELNPDTVVIFATYGREMERLLASNPGLASRVSRVIHFKPYGEEELCDILAYLAARRGYRLPETYRQTCAPFFRELRRQCGEQFGNGREARRLLEAAVEELALRTLDMPGEPARVLTPGDLEEARRRLLEHSVRPEEGRLVRTIGF